MQVEWKDLVTLGEMLPNSGTFRFDPRSDNRYSPEKDWFPLPSLHPTSSFPHLLTLPAFLPDSRVVIETDETKKKGRPRFVYDDSLTLSTVLFFLPVIR